MEGSGKNACDWSAFDARLELLVKAGLEPNIIVVGANEGGTSNYSTPPYVFTAAYAATLGAPPQDQVVCGDWQGGPSSPVHGSSTVSGVWNTNACYSSAGTCEGSADINGFPVVYEKPYMTAYQTFIANVLKHYSPAGTHSGPALASHIGYIRFGMTSGGEATLVCNGVSPGPLGLAAQPLGFSKNAFVGSKADPASGYISSMMAWIHAQTPSVSVGINSHGGPPNGTDLSYANAEAQLAVASHVGFGIEAFGIGDSYLTSRGMPCIDNWCDNFATYADAGVPLVLQNTIAALQPSYAVTDIEGNGRYALATAPGSDLYGGNSAWVQISGSSSSVYDGTFNLLAADAATFALATTSTAAGTGGTLLTPDYLPISIPFAISAHATALELYLCDLLYAFDPNPVAGLTCSTPPGPIGLFPFPPGQGP